MGAAEGHIQRCTAAHAAVSCACLHGKQIQSLVCAPLPLPHAARSCPAGALATPGAYRTHARTLAGTRFSERETRNKATGGVAHGPKTAAAHAAVPACMRRACFARPPGRSRTPLQAWGLHHGRPGALKVITGDVQYAHTRSHPIAASVAASAVTAQVTTSSPFRPPCPPVGAPQHTQHTLCHSSTTAQRRCQARTPVPWHGHVGNARPLSGVHYHG